MVADRSAATVWTLQGCSERTDGLIRFVRTRATTHVDRVRAFPPRKERRPPSFHRQAVQPLLNLVRGIADQLGYLVSAHRRRETRRRPSRAIAERSALALCAMLTRTACAALSPRRTSPSTTRASISSVTDRTCLTNGIDGIRYIAQRTSGIQTFFRRPVPNDGAGETFANSLQSCCIAGPTAI